MKDFLFKHDVPVKKCAADLGISQSYLYQLLKKERKPSLELALRIEEYTKGEVTVSDLLGEGYEISTDNRQEFIENLIEEKLKPVEETLQYLDARLQRLEDPS